MAERVLLVNTTIDNCPIRSPHLGLLYLDAFLKAKGVESDVYDSRFEEGTLLARINQFTPSIVGFTSIAADSKKIQWESQRVREAYPAAQIVYGGIQAAARPQDFLRSEREVVVVGEGENTLYRFIQSLSSGNDWHKLPGLIFSDRSGRIISTGRAPFIKDIDVLPLPQLKKYFGNPRVNQYQIMTSRGCPNSCSFCASEGIWERKLRAHSAERVVAEVQSLAEHDITKFVFVDDSLTVNNRRLSAICDGILKLGKNMNWSANSRVDFSPHADRRKMLREMKEAGCFLVCYGVESGSQAVLDKINKRVTVEQAIEAVRITQEMGISAKANLIVGLPGTFEDQLTLIDFVKRAEPDYLSIHYIMPLPGSALYDHSERFGLVQKASDNVFTTDVEAPQLSYSHSDYSLSSEQIVDAMHACVDGIAGLGYTSDPKPGQKKIMLSPLDVKPIDERPKYFTLLEEAPACT